MPRPGRSARFFVVPRHYQGATSELAPALSLLAPSLSFIGAGLVAAGGFVAGIRGGTIWPVGPEFGRTEMVGSGRETRGTIDIELDWAEIVGLKLNSGGCGTGTL